MIHHSIAALGIADGRYLAHGLVIQYIAFFSLGLYALTMHADNIAILHLHAHFTDGLTVDLHHALGNHFLRMAAACYPAQRQVFLQSHFVHLYFRLINW